MKYIDIHCHVNFDAYDADRDAVIARAQEAGVGMILVGNDRTTSEEVIKLAEQHDNMWAIIGLHPIHAVEESTATGGEFDYETYKKFALHPKVVGIGECGLDYFRADPATKAIQEKVFRAHIKLANEVKKPLVLHIRSSKTEDAYKDAIAVLKDEKTTNGRDQVGDVHFFAGGLDYARQFINLGFCLSFTGVITFAKEYHEVVMGIPLDRIMSETDAPFVAPVPFRGQRCEPVHVIQTAEMIAKLRSEKFSDNPAETKEKVLAQLVQNARTLFKI